MRACTRGCTHGVLRQVRFGASVVELPIRLSRRSRVRTATFASIAGRFGSANSDRERATQRVSESPERGTATGVLLLPFTPLLSSRSLSLLRSYEGQTTGDVHGICPLRVRLPRNLLGARSRGVRAVPFESRGDSAQTDAATDRRVGRVRSGGSARAMDASIATRRDARRCCVATGCRRWPAGAIGAASFVAEYASFVEEQPRAFGRTTGPREQPWRDEPRNSHGNDSIADKSARRRACALQERSELAIRTLRSLACIHVEIDESRRTACPDQSFAVGASPPNGPRRTRDLHCWRSISVCHRCTHDELRRHRCATVSPPNAQELRWIAELCDIIAHRFHRLSATLPLGFPTHSRSTHPEKCAVRVVTRCVSSTDL